MRGKTLLVSVAIHFAVAALALFFTARAKERARRPTTVTVISEKKKEEPKKPPPPPRPAAPPPPKVAAAPRAVAEPKSAPAAPAPIDTGLSFGNDTGPGIAVGPRTAPAPEKPVEKAQVKRAAPPREKPAECTEPPSKPEPVVRTRDIEYTPRARSEGIEGRLVLRVIVGSDGSVSKVDVVSPVEPSLDAAAIATVETWRFNPAMACGRPIGGGVFTIARRFELGD